MKANRNRAGFTLMELIVVLAILSAMLAISAPSLSRFFGGRALENEARRFLALTRYARSEAISRSTPMELWMDVLLGHYGLSPVTGYYQLDNKPPIEFVLDEKLAFEVENNPQNKNSRTVIQYLPDGTITDQSPLTIWIRNRKNRDEIRIERMEFEPEYRIWKEGDNVEAWYLR